jgi:hypothetical protein
MTALVLSVLTLLSGHSAFARDDGEARVVSLLYEQMPAQDIDLIQRLAKCGISGSPIAIIRDPIREGMEGIYLAVEKFDANTICQESSFVFLRDRPFRKRLDSLFASGTSILLALHNEPAWPGAALAYPEILARATRVALGVEPNESDILILSRWASIYDYNTLEQQLLNWRLMNGALEKSLKGIKVEQELYNNLKDFVADARAVDSTLIEIENAGERIEYLANPQHEAEAASDSVIYREFMKQRMLDHMQTRAKTLLTMVKNLAQSRPREFRQILGAVNSMVPTRIMKHLQLNSDFDFDLRTATCVVDLTLARIQKVQAVEEEPTADSSAK